MATMIPVDSLDTIGKIIRKTRKQQGLRQDAVARFSHTFVGEVEKGKPTAQIGKLLELLQELGIRVHLELPSGIEPNTVKKATTR
ncbi:MAG: transcriptional regulator [Rugosibacter sp.]|nr:MAG: transcriptional regulator [Rugosibacter sp.]TBR08047.1 MAG: transcriptional regulator [Rugosibacter sp.]